jgi:hypothetical protein
MPAEAVVGYLADEGARLGGGMRAAAGAAPMAS